MTDNNESRALAIIPTSLTEVQTLAEVLAKSTLLPDALRSKPADVLVQILAGQELGLSPMAAIRGIHLIQGKPVLSADTMVGLILSSGLCDYFQLVEETDTKVTYETKRKGNPQPTRASWSDEDTKTAGLQTKDNWRLHKKQMRRARAKAMLARDVFPDVLSGVYDPDEIRDTQGPRIIPQDAIDAEVVSETVDFSAIDSAETVEQLEQLAKRFKQLPEAAKPEARKRYSARMDQLTRPVETQA